jgi:hypothetical protein
VGDSFDNGHVGSDFRAGHASGTAVAPKQIPEPNTTASSRSGCSLLHIVILHRLNAQSQDRALWHLKIQQPVSAVTAAFRVMAVGAIKQLRSGTRAAGTTRMLQVLKKCFSISGRPSPRSLDHRFQQRFGQGRRMGCCCNQRESLSVTSMAP